MQQPTREKLKKFLLSKIMQLCVNKIQFVECFLLQLYFKCSAKKEKQQQIEACCMYSQLSCKWTPLGIRQKCPFIELSTYESYSHKKKREKGN